MWGLGIHGKINTLFLSLNNDYRCFLVYKITEGHHIMGFDPMKASVSVIGGYKSTKLNVSLDLKWDGNRARTHVTRQRNL